MRLNMALILVGGVCYGAVEGWQRKEQSGGVAYFKGDEAMVAVVPPKPVSGDLRLEFAKALRNFLGGNVVVGGDIRDAGGGALMAEYEVQEPNGSRTHRAAMAWVRDGRLEALLYATNDAAAYQRHRAEAMEFFASYRGGDGAVVGEWYTGRISTIQRQDSVTGALAPPSGNNMTYKFLADGTYHQYGLMQFTYATCINSYFMNITGRYTLRGDELTTTPIDGTFESRTCGGQPVRKPTAKAISVFNVRVSGNELTMTDAKGASSAYRRK
ncbi:MAG: hypothetical protein ACKV2U_05815 [Bryobacteraceae bacterium]